FHPFVPRVIRMFRETHPLVALTLDESGTAELVGALRAERIDAAFVRSPIGAAPGIAVHSVLQEEMVAVLPAGHRLAGGGAAARPGWLRRSISPIAAAKARPLPAASSRWRGRPRLDGAVSPAARNSGTSRAG